MPSPVARLEGGWVAKNAFRWQQCFFVTHVSLHIVQTRGWQTCSIKKSFAEIQKNGEPQNQLVVSIKIW